MQSQAALAWGAAVLMVATDVMVFAGADPGQAADAVREGTGEFDVPDLPPTRYHLKLWIGLPHESAAYLPA